MFQKKRTGFLMFYIGLVFYSDELLLASGNTTLEHYVSSQLLNDSQSQNSSSANNTHDYSDSDHIVHHSESNLTTLHHSETDHTMHHSDKNLTVFPSETFHTALHSEIFHTIHHSETEAMSGYITRAESASYEMIQSEPSVSKDYVELNSTDGHANLTNTTYKTSNIIASTNLYQFSSDEFNQQSSYPRLVAQRQSSYPRFDQTLLYSSYSQLEIAETHSSFPQHTESRSTIVDVDKMETLPNYSQTGHSYPYSNHLHIDNTQIYTSQLNTDTVISPTSSFTNPESANTVNSMSGITSQSNADIGKTFFLTSTPDISSRTSYPLNTSVIFSAQSQPTRGTATQNTIDLPYNTISDHFKEGSSVTTFTNVQSPVTKLLHTESFTTVSLFSSSVNDNRLASNTFSSSIHHTSEEGASHATPLSSAALDDQSVLISPLSVAVITSSTPPLTVSDLDPTSVSIASDSINMNSRQVSLHMEGNSISNDSDLSTMTSSVHLLSRALSLSSYLTTSSGHMSPPASSTADFLTSSGHLLPLVSSTPDFLTSSGHSMPVASSTQEYLQTSSGHLLPRGSTSSGYLTSLIPTENTEMLTNTTMVTSSPNSTFAHQETGNVSFEIRFVGDCNPLVQKKIVLEIFWEELLLTLSSSLRVRKSAIKPKDIACNPIRISIILLDVQRKNTSLRFKDLITSETLRFKIPFLAEDSMIEYEYKAISVKTVPLTYDIAVSPELYELGLSKVDIVVIIVACCISMVLILIGCCICAREHYIRNRSRTFNMTDVVNLNANLQDYTLSKIPRKPTYYGIENGVKMRSFGKKDGLQAKALLSHEETEHAAHDGMEGKDVHIRMKEYDDGIVIGVTTTPKSYRTECHSRPQQPDDPATEQLCEAQTNPHICMDNPIYFADDDNYTIV